MKKTSPEKVLEIAYKNLYNSTAKNVDKNLTAFLKAKRNYAKLVLLKQNNTKN